MNENKYFMEKLLLLLRLFESWINYYHKEKKILYVAFVNIVFILVLSMFMFIITYGVVFIITLKILLKPIYIYLLYVFILFIISFQNILDKNYNIANKMKMLFLSISEGITFGGICKSFLFYIVGCFSIFLWLISVMYNDKIDENQVILIIMLVCILEFIIFVYGTSDFYIRNRRKLLLYGISSIVTFVSTVNSLSGTFDSIDLKFCASIMGLILSIDRFTNTYSSLMKDYETNHKSDVKDTEELCEKMNLTFGQIYNIIKDKLCRYINNLQQKLGNFIKKEYKEKIKIILRIVFSLIFAIIVTSIVFIIGIGGSEYAVKILGDVLNYIVYSLEFADTGLVGVFWGIVRFIIKMLLCIAYCISVMFCLFFIKNSLKSIKNQIKNKNKFQVIEKGFRALSTSLMILSFILVIPSAFFDKPLELYIHFLKIVIWLTTVEWIIHLLCYVISRIERKIDEYKKK